MKDDVTLDAPGAGLPGIESWVARLVFPLVGKLRSPKAFARLFEKESELILDLVKGMDEATGSKRVLINRIRGIEDSSRQWSIFMTLEHLAVVNHGIARTIESLRQGKAPNLKVRIEDVKPDPGAGPETVEKFVESLEPIRKAGEGIEKVQTRIGHKHPWFGEISARQWYALSAAHLGIHRRQIELIIEGLG
ncbi:MAG: DinB family protein [Akkermansiaceae bacterium]|jgi:hypothetical protein